ncbi:CU044_5270 family protein [Spirillospora sp. NPDC048819]|uniref:CU044_5270 family protein n=1 Tax=Spirillospora sp. NPDC048819 TaxID=3155268 RepID=UPI00340C01DD
MDELRMIKEAYGEPVPPAPRETAEVRARMFGAPRSARSGWRLRAGLGVVAVGAATAVAIAAVGSGGPSTGGGVAGGGPQGEVNLGKEAVLVAAENAAKQEIGKYWFSDDVGGQSYVVQADTGSYVMVGAHTESFRWTGAEPGSAAGGAWRMLPARPQTPDDLAAWKKAGSPTKIKAWSGDKWLTLNTAEKTAWDVEPSDPSGGGEWYGRMTTEELQNLPADPEKLTEKFLTDEAMRWRAVGLPSPEKLKELEEKRGPLPKREFDSFSKLGVVGGLIANSPVPPKVRAGLMRAATAVPGVEAIGEVVDPLGRRGVALASASRTIEITGETGTPPERQGTYKARKELVFDKETGEVLASQYVLTKAGGPYKDRRPGFVIDYTAIRDMGWTDTKPAPPAKLPF